MNTQQWPREWVDDPRSSPLFTFQVPSHLVTATSSSNNGNVGNHENDAAATTGTTVYYYYGLYLMSVAMWIELLVWMLLQVFLLSVPVSWIMYEAVIRPRRRKEKMQEEKEHKSLSSLPPPSRTMYLIALGMIAPFWCIAPPYLLDCLNIQNPFFRFSLVATPATAFFRVLASLWGYIPAHAVNSWSDYALYFASPMPIQYNKEARKYCTVNALQISQHLIRLLALCWVTGMYQSLFSSPSNDENSNNNYNDTTASIFPRLGPAVQPYSRDDWYSFKTLFDVYRWKDSFLYAVLLQLYLSTFGEGFTFFTTAVTGLQVSHSVMDNPMFTATSPSEFWGRKWNFIMHDCFKNGVYKPVRAATATWKKNTTTVLAVMASFVASGLFHEWLLPVIFQGKHPFNAATNNDDGSDSIVTARFWDGAQLVFFGWQAVLVAGEAVIVGHRAAAATVKQLSVLLPVPVQTILVFCTGLPIAPWFFELYVTSNFFICGRLLFPVVLPLMTTMTQQPPPLPIEQDYSDGGTTNMEL